MIQNADALTAQVTMYATDWCPFCVRAEKLLVSKGANVKKINVEEHRDERQNVKYPMPQRAAFTSIGEEKIPIIKFVSSKYV